MKQIRIGYGREPRTQMGPVVSPKQRDRVMGYLDKASIDGAELLLVGERPRFGAGKGIILS